MPNTMYELGEQYAKLVEFSEEEDVDISEILAGIDSTMDQHIENLVLTIREIEAQETAVKTEEDRMKAKKKIIGNHKDRVKSYIRELLEVSGKTKAGGVLGTAALQKSPMSLVIDDKNLIPDDFLKASLTIPLSELPEELSGHPSLKIEVDKKSILELARNDDYEIEGTHTEQNKHLRLR